MGLGVRQVPIPIKINMYKADYDIGLDITVLDHPGGDCGTPRVEFSIHRRRKNMHYVCFVQFGSKCVTANREIGQ